MIYRFGPFELDLAAVELRADGVSHSLEPQVFRLLALLIENHGRLVSKDEIIEKVWDGRAVSDAAVASRVKSARQALGDDGRRQQFIKTVHRLGFRFIADIKVGRDAPPHLYCETGDPKVTKSIGVLVRQLERMSRPSLAVLPFRTNGNYRRCHALASALLVGCSEHCASWGFENGELPLGPRAWRAGPPCRYRCPLALTRAPAR